MPVSDIMISAFEDAAMHLVSDKCAGEGVQYIIDQAWTRYDLAEELPPEKAPSGNRWLMYCEAAPDGIMVAMGFRITSQSEPIWLADPADFFPIILKAEKQDNDE